ncbi:MAG: hypothetical protein MUC88_06685 [Planctomycetes bacterium]|nr:hypothetical protein [Planctomycetota bacterium]
MSKSLQQRIIETSHQLRLVQRGFADAEASQQTEYLGEELDRRLKEIPYGERQAFLQGLLAQFPTARSDRPAAGDQARPRNDGSQPALVDPLSLAQCLVEKLSSVTPDDRQAVLDRLRQTVPELSRTAGNSGASGPDGKSPFPLPDGLAPERLSLLASLLTEFVVKLERWTTSVWAELPSKTTLRPPKHMEEIARRFLSEEKRTTDEITEELRLLQQCVTISMAAARKAADDVARRLVQRLAPEAIQAAVAMEPKSLGERLVSSEIRYWRKYCEMAQELLEPEYVDREIMVAMAQYADAFLKKLERSAKSPGGL